MSNNDMSLKYLGLDLTATSDGIEQAITKRSTELRAAIARGERDGQQATTEFARHCVGARRWAKEQAELPSSAPQNSQRLTHECPPPHPPLQHATRAGTRYRWLRFLARTVDTQLDNRQPAPLQRPPEKQSVTHSMPYNSCSYWLVAFYCLPCVRNFRLHLERRTTAGTGTVPKRPATTPFVRG